MSLKRLACRPLRAAWAPLLALVVAASGCGGGNDPAASEGVKAEPPVRISGSGSTAKLLERFAPDYSAVDGHPRLEFLEGTDSAGGIAAVGAGKIEIGAVSRSPKPDEMRQGVVYRSFARDAVAFVGDDPASLSVTRKQLRAAFAGKTRNWRQLGGRDVPIVLLVRDEDESVTQVLRRELFGERFRFARSATVLSSADDMNQALADTPGALGFTSYGSLISARTGLKPLAVGDMRPDVTAIEEGKYPFTRDLGVVFRPAPATSDLASYLTSPQIARRLRTLGYAPRA